MYITGKKRHLSPFFYIHGLICSFQQVPLLPCTVHDRASLNPSPTFTRTHILLPWRFPTQTAMEVITCSDRVQPCIHKDCHTNWWEEDHNRKGISPSPVPQRSSGNKKVTRIIIICNIHRSRRFTNFFNDAASLPISSTITLNILLWNIANPTTGGLINQLEAPIHTYLGSPSQFQQVMRRITGKKGTIAPKWGTYSLIIVMHPSIDFRSAVLQDGFYSFLANLLRR